MKLLVTGFGPFPRVPRNPSAALARKIAASPRLRRMRVDACALVLTTAYAALEDELLPTLAREQPNAVLMIGVASRRRAMSLEARAVNRVSRLYPDADGQVGTALALDPSAPHALGSNAPADPLRRAAGSRGTPLRPSRDAGRYLCNAAYFRALQQGRAAGAPVVFVHIPLPRPPQTRAAPSRPPAAAMESALVRLAVALVRRARFNRSLSIRQNDADRDRNVNGSGETRGQG